jgi:hypothetical protein
MKRFLKIFSLSFMVILFGCDNNDGRFGDNPNLGWVEFSSAASTTVQAPVSISIPLSINVPVYQDGLNISYTITAVQGDYTQFINSSGGVAFADPSDVTRSVSIELPVVNGDLGRDFITIFDVTLTAVDVDGVNIGVDNESILTHRVTLPCINPLIVNDTFFVGDYLIEDVVATIGPGNGTENFGTGTVTLVVDPLDPNIRTFSANVLPAFVPTPTDAAIAFREDGATLSGIVNPGIGCTAFPYVYTGAGADKTPWDICNDQSIIINYTEDVAQSCGGPYEASFRLTKL